MSSAKLTPTTNSHPCPVCSDTTGKCRHGSRGDGYIQCMTYAGAHSAPNGWHFIGDTQDGSWGQFVPTQEKDNRERQDWEARKAERQRQAQERRQRELFELSQALPIDERSAQNRKFLLGLEELVESHRENLENRGLTPEQIQQGLFRSVAPRLRLKNPVSPRLAGVARDGLSAWVSGCGILCPAYDIYGRIIGMQLRLDDSENGRYRWLKSEFGSKLPNGEMPLTIVKPEGKVERIGLCEGILKPYIAAKRSGNTLFIGASGGNFKASRQQLEETLKWARREYGDLPLAFYPDAGSLGNKQVLRQIETTLKLKELRGWEPKIAWWGQSQKESHDIDEISDFESIKYLTQSQWQKRIENYKNSEEAKQKRIEDDRRYSQLTQLSVTPWKEVNTPNISSTIEELESGAIYIVQSAKGTYKTESLPPFIEAHNNCHAWFSRIALGREECARIGLEWKEIDPNKRENIVPSFNDYEEPKIRLGFCADSAYQYAPEKLNDNGLLLLDEFDQVIDHAFGSTCNKGGKRPAILASLEAQIAAAIEGSGTVLAMSADIADKEIELLREIAPAGCPIRVIVNHYQPKRGEVYLNRSEKPDGQIEELLAALERGQPCFVIDDMKNGVRGCKSIAEYMRSIHPEWEGEIVEINADTSGSEEIVEYLQNINTDSQTTRLLCCSPSVVSGISITNGRFNDGVFAFLNGILTVNNASQAIARVRGAESINVWVAEEGLIYAANRSTDPEEIKAWYQRNYKVNTQHIHSFGVEYEPMRGEWDSPFFKLYCQNAAYRNLCMDRLGDRMEERLREEGYIVFVTSGGDSDMVERGLKQAWTKIEIGRAKAIAEAELLSDEELKEFENSETRPTEEEQHRIEKTWLLKKFGEELIEATTFKHKETEEILTGYAAMCLKDNRGEYKRKLDQFYLLVQDAEKAIEKDVAGEKRQREHDEGRFAADIRWNTRKRQCREKLGLKKFLDPNQWWEPGDYWSVTEKAKQYPTLIKDCLNLSVEKISNGQVFGELIGQIGLELDKKWAEKWELKPNQKRFKRRKISDESWEYAQLYVKYQEQLEAQRERERQERERAEQQRKQASQSSQPQPTPPPNPNPIINESGQYNINLEREIDTNDPDSEIVGAMVGVYDELYRKGELTREELEEFSDVLTTEQKEKFYWQVHQETRWTIDKVMGRPSPLVA